MTDKLTLTKLELLRMARELVINEYIDKRAQDHNAWLAQADVVWRTQGVRLAYPAFPQYPNEVDILTRARALNTFLSLEDQAAEKAASEAVVEAPQVSQVANTVSTQSLVSAAAEPDIIDVKAEDVKDIAQAAPTNYVSNPAIFGEILNKQTQSLPSAVANVSEQPMSALAKLKNTLGLK
jgi:hypothetical protein